jgi:hypothetical protein
VNIPEQREEHGSAFLDPGDALDATLLCLDLDALVHGGFVIRPGRPAGSVRASPDQVTAADRGPSFN